MGIQPVGVFTELEDSPTNKVYVVIPYDSPGVFATIPARLAADTAYQKAAAEYLAAAIADYRREALAGRVALPVDELLAAGIEDADLAAAEPPAHLQSYLKGLRGRAAQLFAVAATELPAAQRAQLRHLPILAALGTKNLNRPAAAADAGVRLRDLYLAWITARRAAAHG